MPSNSSYTDFELMYLLVGFFVLLNAAFSWLAFAHFSMRPLERKLRALKKDSVSEWDGPGWRTATYAIKLALPPGIWGNYNMFLDPYLLHKLATSADTKRAIWFWLSWLTAIAMAIGFTMFIE